MPGIMEVLNALYGSYRLARLDVGGYTYFNVTAAGFWRSFAAILLVAPLYYLTSVSLHEITAVVVSEAQPDPALSTADTGAALTGLALQWAAWPIAMIFVARVLQVTQHYARFIIAYNWSTVFQMAVLMVPHALFMAGLLGAGPAHALIIVSIGFLIFYSWFIVRTALDVSGLIATGIVVFDIALGLVIGDIIDALFA
jgi:hypothetical protein